MSTGIPFRYLGTLVIYDFDLVEYYEEYGKHQPVVDDPLTLCLRAEEEGVEVKTILPEYWHN
jgi:hypothetical protein